MRKKKEEEGGTKPDGSDAHCCQSNTVPASHYPPHYPPTTPRFVQPSADGTRLCASTVRIGNNAVPSHPVSRYASHLIGPASQHGLLGLRWKCGKCAYLHERERGKRGERGKRV